MTENKQPTLKELLFELGEKCKLYRFKERLTLDELATKANVSSVLLSNVEKGELPNTSFKKIIQIAGAVDCTLTISLKDNYVEKQASIPV